MAETWRGNFLDANGRKGAVELHSSESGKSGTLSVRIPDRASPLDFESEVTIERDGATTRLRAAQRLKEGLVEWQANLTREEAAPYAKAALLGEYTAKGGGREIPLTRGVMILWQFGQ